MEDSIQTFRVIAYFAYLAIAIGLTMYLARTLSTNGAVFLMDVFDNPELAKAINKLLVTGFYMLNLGWACVLLNGYYGTTLDALLLHTVERLGTLLFSLGIFHFFNLYLFHRIRRRAKPAEPAAPSNRTFAARAGAGRPIRTDPRGSALSCPGLGPGAARRACGALALFPDGALEATSSRPQAGRSGYGLFLARLLRRRTCEPHPKAACEGRDRRLCRAGLRSF